MNKSIRGLELDKILASVSSYAVLEGGKEKVLSLVPAAELEPARQALAVTQEATLLLFTLGAGRMEYFPPLGDLLERAEKGATLSCAELTASARLLRSARVCYRSVHSFAHEGIVLMKSLTERLIFDERLEEEIDGKIIGDALADHASEKLFSIRREIRLLGERIRARLSEYLVSERKYLQDGVITVRGDRFVLPVKVEYKRNVKGFIHDRSASGATVFIEPEEVLELNNELRSLQLDEKEEEEHILSELSHALGRMRTALETDIEVLNEIDGFYARAEYGYRLKCVLPQLNGRGMIDIIKGRHPLLDPKTAVPVTVSVGENYRFLIVSGANTGGKTVTLKMCGLFCLMAACGLFVPAEEGTRLSVFDGVFCDIGDSQSIEENLSTFSSHILNVKEILGQATQKSFVLIDEPGGGTDPEEGQALAQAIVKDLMNKGCLGIVTTHYSALKEFAIREAGIENGCMEFDSESLRPLYRLRIGQPGSSNALLICSRLGLSEEVISSAREGLSEGARVFEHTVRAAEESRIKADEARARASALEKEWRERLDKLQAEEDKFRKERERFLTGSKAEARRIVVDRTQRAEEILSQIEAIFEQERLTESDLIRARTLKNKMGREEEEESEPVRLVPINVKDLKAGDGVFIGGMNAEGIVLSLKKDSAEVQCGALRVKSKLSDLYQPPKKKTQKKDQVQVVKNLSERAALSRECNVIGLSAAEAVVEVEAFLDGALLQNLSEVRIVHGMGTGKLRAAIHEFLRKQKRVREFRLGKYGEGESGVTVVTLQ